MKHFIYSLFLTLITISCQTNEIKESKSVIESDTIINKEYNDLNTLNKEKYYTELMKNKYISLKKQGSCDEAGQDTSHEWYKVYVENEKMYDSLININFKFIETCCKEFMGDYYIKNDTLFFEFEQSNELACSCVCWYRYNLEIKNIKAKFKKVIIKDKK